MPVGRRSDKQSVACTHSGLLALKRKEIVTPATTRMNLEDVALSEISQSQKDESCVIPLREVPRVIKLKGSTVERSL